jgi:raffinose/stachyose/melibiose transport system substrate-binding protein
VRDDVDFFTLPTTTGSVTAANEYVTSSGIGMAVSTKSFDPLVRDFLKFALARYYKLAAAQGNLEPTTDVTTTLPADATPLYQKALETAAKVGDKLAMPWDTQLDPTSNSRLQQELVLLVQGNITAEQFIDTVDTTIKQNAPKYFG